MHLVKIGYRMFNFDLLVDAEFAPPENGVDEETGKEWKRAAKLKLRFAAPESDARLQCDGDYVGEETSPYTRVLNDEDAMEAWDALYHVAWGK